MQPLNIMYIHISSFLCDVTHGEFSTDEYNSYTILYLFLFEWHEWKSSKTNDPIFQNDRNRQIFVLFVCLSKSTKIKYILVLNASLSYV